LKQSNDDHSATNVAGFPFRQEIIPIWHKFEYRRLIAMHPNFTLDYFPAEYYTRPSTEHRRLGLFSRIMSKNRSVITHQGNVSFKPLVDETKSRMQHQLDESRLVPGEFLRRDSLHGKIELHASQWSIHVASKPIGSLRMVYIHGPKNQIINTWVFPNRPRRMPVFAAELIAVGTEVRVAFVDIQVPVIDTPSVLDDTSMLTGGINYTYARNVPADCFHQVEECYTAYLDAYLKGFASKSVGSSLAAMERDEIALDRLQAYQHHHMESSPGNKFLSKLFGPDWTESFMRDFLFAKPRG
jgi:hypothetical protein